MFFFDRFIRLADVLVTVIFRGRLSQPAKPVFQFALLAVLCGLCEAGVAQTVHLIGAETTIATSSMDQPAGIAVDSSGNVYVADADHARVLKETYSNGSYTESTIASASVQAQQVAVDSSGNVYFGDGGTGRVLKETPTGSGYTQSAVPTSALTNIGALAVDAAGSVYVVDTGHNRVLKETPAGDTYTEVTVASALNSPHGVAVDGSGNVYVADTGNNRILKETFSSGTYTESVIVSTGLASPWDIAADSAGNLYIADTAHNRILKETLSGGSYVESVLPTGYLNNALSLAVDRGGVVYVLQTIPDTNLILKELPPNSALNFGSSKVGTAAPSATLYFTFDTPGSPGTPKIVTQGTPDLDFTSNGSSCNWGHPYNAGDTCTMGVSFKPKFPGVRYGAVVLTNGSGDAIGTTYLQGSGVGPQVSFPPGALSELPFHRTVYTMTVDGAGNVYLVQAFSENHPNNAVFKETWNGSGYTESVVATGLSYPTNVAVDGAGNVYICDQDAYRVYKETPTGSGGYTQSIVDGTLGTVMGLAVDGAGNVYVGRGGIGVEKETYTGGSYSRSQIFSYIAAIGIAVDASGTLYIPRNGYGIYKETWNGSGYTESIIPTSSAVDRIAVDASGNLYLPAGSFILKEEPSGNSYVESGISINGGNLLGIAFDGAGNLYYSTTAVWKVDSATAPSLSFTTAPFNSASADSPKTVTLKNIGNAALSFPISDTGDNPSVSSSFTLNTNSSSGCPVVEASSSVPGVLAAGASCQLSIDFRPSSIGAIQGSLVLTDDTLNAAGPSYATQTLSLSGTGVQATPEISWAIPAPISYGTLLGSAQLNAQSTATGSFTYMPAAGTVLGPGSQTLTATFTPVSPDDYTTASKTVTLEVTKGSPGVLLVASTNRALVSNAVTFTATVSSSAATPGGTISFYDGTTLLGTANLSSGAASYTTSSLAVGVHSITAVYSGDPNFVSQASSAVAVTMEDFTVAPTGGSSTSATVSAGGSAVYTLMLAPPDGGALAAPVSFTAAGLPSGWTATFSPTTIPAGSGAANVTITVTAGAKAAMQPRFAPLNWEASPVVVGLILLPFGGRLRRSRSRVATTAVLIVMVIASMIGMAGLTGCSSGKDAGSGGQSSGQTYDFTVTATSGALSHTTTLHLTVK
ncbi:Ig-like domain repeat protein [Edaphobacter sp. HDX4]|uniref:Ig-like domain repeat protein n=1 Tax=Edaphobacter sp. HDX4 TaxID=2794064 RepID=UPI002FE65E80